MKNKLYFKEFAKYASLNVLAMIGLSCYILEDIFFISKGLVTNGLSALNLAIPVTKLLVAISGITIYSPFKKSVY